ncbi:MAG TPA: hypothetical protein VLT89_00940 [Usitatibacter sp.]|nr:hypothetical protein [Usitatibacter sp.]
MNAPHTDDAQRDLEQRALRNVRGLVDKMEGLDAVDKSQQRRYMTGLVVGAIVFAAVLAGVLWFGGHDASQAVVIETGKAAPAK